MRSARTILLGWGLILTTFSLRLCAQEVPPFRTALVRSGWVRTEVIVGRLSLMNTRTGQGRITAGKNGGEGQEQLTVDAEHGQIHLTYEAEIDQDHITLQVTNERDITFRRERKGENRPIEVDFRQPAQGKLTLKVNHEGVKREYTADNFWQLLLSADAHGVLGLNELLSTIKPQWHLQESLTRIETELWQESEHQRRTEWDRWISELSAEEYDVRMRADRALRNSGKYVVGYLLHLNFAKLDSEQRLRIRRILNDMTLDAGDSPETAASFVRDDVRVWLRLLETAEPARQELAISQVRRISGRSVSLKPAETPVQQIEYVSGLRKSLGIR